MPSRKEDLINNSAKLRENCYSEARDITEMGATSRILSVIPIDKNLANAKITHFN